MKWTVSQNVRATLLQNQTHIFGLFGIAVAYPVFTFLQANPAYLLVNKVTDDYLDLVIVILLVVFPAFVITVSLEIWRHSNRVYHAVHLLTIIGFVFLMLMPLFSRIQGVGFWPVLGFAAIGTGLIVHQYRNNIFTYYEFSLLAPVTILISFQFMHDHHIAQILNLEENEIVEWKAPINDDETPVVMVVFDALPMMYLLDA